MSRFESITIREIETADLEAFYEYQLDPEAIRMAAFVCEDPKDKAAFDAHWDRILKSPRIIKRTILADGQVAGTISCYPNRDKMEVTYRIGREFWGRGVATRALERMLHLVVDRPMFARAAADNVGSVRVLQKCGFQIVGKDRDFANGRGEEAEEYVLRLDPDPPSSDYPSGAEVLRADRSPGRKGVRALRLNPVGSGAPSESHRLPRRAHRGAPLPPGCA